MVQCTGRPYDPFDDNKGEVKETPRRVLGNKTGSAGMSPRRRGG